MTTFSVPPKAINLIVELFVAATGVSPSPSEASLSGKCKGKELLAGLPVKRQTKIGERSSTAIVEFWKSKLSAFELGK